MDNVVELPEKVNGLYPKPETLNYHCRKAGLDNNKLVLHSAIVCALGISFPNERFSILYHTPLGFEVRFIDKKAEYSIRYNNFSLSKNALIQRTVKKTV